MKNFYSIILLFCSFWWVTSGCYGQKKHKILLSEPIFFPSGAAEVLAKYRPLLQNVVNLSKQYPDASIWLHAHTDSVGTEKDNEALSLRRGLAVEAILSQCGADTSRFELQSYGEYSPLADDGSEQGRAENRRVMVYVVRPFNEEDFIISARLAGRITDGQSQAGVAAMLVLSYLGGKDTIYTDAQGYYERNFELITNVEARVYAKGYFFSSKVAALANKERTELNFGLEKAIIGGKMMLNDLYFEGGTPRLLPASELALESVLTFLQLNEGLRVEIGGHINKPNQPAVDTNSSSFQLSLQRAKSVYDFLLSKGVAGDRLDYKGYGNWQMIHPQPTNTVEEQLNRRVELKIIN